MNNIKLFVILVILIVFTYYFEERGDEQKEVLKRITVSWPEIEKNKIPINSIELPNVEIVKKDSQFVVTMREMVVDELKFYEYLMFFSNIKIDRRISGEEKHVIEQSYQSYFPDPKQVVVVSFVDRKIAWRIGKKLDYDQSFYLEETIDGSKNFYIVYDDSALVEMYEQKDAHRADGKYIRFLSILNIAPDYFYSTYFFSKMFKGKKVPEVWQKVVVNNRTNKGFSIDFVKQTTNPEAFSGIAMFIDKIDDYGKKLLGLKGKKILFDNNDNNFKNHQADLILCSRYGCDTKLFLYKKYLDKEGYFIKGTGIPYAYELSSDDAFLFFANIQDFWHKSIFSRTILKPGSIYDLTLSFKNNPTVKIVLSYGQGLMVMSSGKNEFDFFLPAFQRMLDFLTSEADVIYQADDKLNKKLWKGAPLMVLEFLNTKLNIYQNMEDVFVVNENKNISYRFYKTRNDLLYLKIQNYVR